MILYIQLPKCYKVLRQVLLFPEKACLYSKYHEIITKIKFSLIGIDRSLELGRFSNYKDAAKEMDLILYVDYNDYEFVADDEIRKLNPSGDESISVKEIFYTSGFIFMMILLKSSDP